MLLRTTTLAGAAALLCASASAAPTPQVRSMLDGAPGVDARSIFTVGDTYGGYTAPGLLDGMGAYALDSDTVRVLANHELLNFRGYPYEVENGSGGTFSLTGARISYFDIDKATLEVTAAGLAYDRIYDATGAQATSLDFQPSFLSGFSRFCSSGLSEAEQFGGGRGLEDRIYFTGEEDGGGFNTVGGGVWALDVDSRDFWQVPALGRGAWENVTVLDTGDAATVAVLLMDDSSPFDVDQPFTFPGTTGDADREAAPLYLYIGTKNASGDFLAQNGLRGGTLYVWVADDATVLTPTQFNGSGAQSGSWVAIDNSQNLAQATDDGSTGFDEYGYPTQRNLWLQAEAVGAFGFSRPEDCATNPADGSECVLASTGVDTYEGGVDTFGTIYTLKTNFADLSAELVIAYDGDADPARKLRSPDNLTWADNGKIYVQEDEAEEDTLDGEPLFGMGAANPAEASIVVLDLDTGAIEPFAEINRGVILDNSIASPSDAIDTDAGSAGEWESSGIIDVSSLFGRAAGSFFLANVQAHGIEDQDGFNPASRINDDDLVEGGQLLFLSASRPSMVAGENGYRAGSIFTVGETFDGYTPPGILDGMGAYERDADTVRVLANHELLNFRGYPYEVEDGMGGTFTLTGARISYFDINKADMQVVGSGLAYDRIYDATGAQATSLDFQPSFLSGFSRFCSSGLSEAEEFGSGRGLEDRIYFTGEEDGGGFNTVGGGIWALDVANDDLWQVPALGRGAWENVTVVDTGDANTVALVLADDSSPFDVDQPFTFPGTTGDADREAAPMYLYVGTKNAAGDFLAQNGLRGGTLYVWVADDATVLTPTQFNGSGTQSGSWVAIDNSQNLAQASDDGSTGFDEYGYPTQRNLWLQAEAAGSFGFSRPEDVATNPFDGTEVVIASTGVDTYENGVDTFGTVYVLKTDFGTLTADLTIAYDGDADASRALRSPDNLEWADNGKVYVQEDEAEEDTLSGEPLFGMGAANPFEASIVELDVRTGVVSRVAEIDRNVILDASIAQVGGAVDTDAGAAGEWESSGVIDVSSLFGKSLGTLFLINVQAHGIEDQDGFNPASRINDSDLVEGGQLLFLENATLGDSYCVAGTNSAGMQATIRAEGSDVLLENDLTLVAEGTIPSTLGVFVAGTSQAVLPVGSGFLCVGGAVTRLDVVASDAAGVATQSLDVFSLPLSNVVMAGQTAFFQLWYRDGMSDSNLTNALGVAFN